MEKKDSTKYRLQILFTPEELKILEARSRAAGFQFKTEYIRYILFLDLSLKEKINQIHQKLIQND